jgi:hypothetical protein
MTGGYPYENQSLYAVLSDVMELAARVPAGVYPQRETAPCSRYFESIDI